MQLKSNNSILLGVERENLAQEDFVDGAHRMLHHGPHLARRCFRVLVAQAAYPFDDRQADFVAAGLIVVHRSDVGLPGVPDCERQRGYELTDKFAINTWSLNDSYESGKLLDAALNAQGGLQLGPDAFDFIASLTELLILPVSQ